MYYNVLFKICIIIVNVLNKICNYYNNMYYI